MRYALGLPGVSGIAIGMYDEEELGQTLAWVHSCAPLTADDLTAIERPTHDLAHGFLELYGPRV